MLELENSIFQEKVLELDSVKSLKVCSIIEHLPSRWSHVDVSLVHAYMVSKKFDMHDA